MIPVSDTQLDPLTGLLKREAFRSELTAALATARSAPTEGRLSLALLDIDYFMQINQEYGHLGGDHVLVALADIMRQGAGEGAVIFRYGGDEFAMILPGMEREQAFLALERIRATVAQHEIMESTGQVIKGIPISGGVASFPVDGRTETELFRKADQALYRAKAAGRGQIRLAYEERMLPKTAHFTQTQLERLSKLAEEHGVSEADLLRESLDDLLTKYGVNDIESGLPGVGNGFHQPRVD